MRLRNFPRRVSDMNRDTIRNTAICRFDQKSKVYVVESPLLDICIGAAKKEKEAWKIFNDLLEAMYVKYLEGKIVGRYKNRGRPSKGGVQFHAAIKPATKEVLEDLAAEVGCSQGEVVDYLAAFYNAKSNGTPEVREPAGEPYNQTAKKTKSDSRKSQSDVGGKSTGKT